MWKENLAFLKAIRDRSGIEMYAGGMLGCRGDAYTGEGALSESDAYRFHRRQAEAFRRAGRIIYMPHSCRHCREAIGMARRWPLPDCPTSSALRSAGTGN